MVSHWQLRPIYKDLQIHKTNDKTSKVIDKKKDLSVGLTRLVNHPVL